LVEGLENVVAIGVNCIKPELGIDLIKLIKKITKKPIVIYPNRGDDFNVNSREF
jgi:homocysteine S-methyltransferase